ncbi:MAG: aminotransferase class IV family protein [Bacteroidales bacterium]|nr:aminotransferase class IV family protein [Bacteroidales bacterium]
MSECFGNYFIRNGVLTPCGLFESSDVYEGDSFYEVIRMMGGVPLFFSDHMQRLEYSVSHSGAQMIVLPETVAESTIILRKHAGVREANLKVVFNYNGGKATWLIYFIEPLYPTQQQYREGVPTILYHAERENPGVKIINHRLRSSIYHKLIATGAYEAFLVDADGLITEGSRSNLFFVKENRLYTAPDEKVLGGITRKHVVDICRLNGIDVVFDCIPAVRIADYESAFMTGTSPMVLPVCSIDRCVFDTGHPLLARLLELYMVRVKESLAAFRRP